MGRKEETKTAESIDLSNGRLSKGDDSKKKSFKKIPRSCVELNLQGNGLTEIFREVFDLPRLTSLNVSENRLTIVPGDVSRATLLSVLELEGNAIASFGMPLPRSLTVLSLSRNQLVELPDDIGSLENLRELRASENKIVRIPQSIGALRKLEILSLAHNQIQHIPDELFGLPQLTLLRLSHNKIHKLPEDLSGAKKLALFYVSANLLEEIPGSIASLTELMELDFSFNSLRSLPSISTLLDLEKLILVNNRPLVALPDLTQLRKLRILGISGTSFPQELQAMQVKELIERLRRS